MSKDHKTQLLVEDVRGITISKATEVYERGEYIREMLINTTRGVVRVAVLSNEEKNLAVTYREGK